MFNSYPQKDDTTIHSPGTLVKAQQMTGQHLN